LVLLTHLFDGGDALMNRDFVMAQPAMAGKNTRAMLYVRVGAEADQERAETTGSRQRDECREWCERNEFVVVEAGGFR